MKALVLLSVLLSGQAVGLAQRVVGPLELGSGSAEPGEVVELPVYFSSPYPLCLFSVLVCYPGLDFLGYEIEGSAAEGVDPRAVGWVVFDNLVDPPCRGKVALFGIFSGCLRPEEHRIPAGERLLLGRLRFRVRGEAETGQVWVEPVSDVRDVNVQTEFVLEVDGALENAEASLINGQVTVLPPTRPRPVDDLACTQFLDRVELRFSALGAGVGFEPYDGFDLLRDGVLVATLSPEARSHTEPLPELGRHTYSIIGRRGEESSLPASCEVLVVEPAAPPPRDVRCNEDGSLSWQNGAAYERILILRNGEEIAELPGDGWYFADPLRPEGPTVYSVVGELQGFFSPEASCIAQGVWVMEAGDVRVPVGANRVVVPIYVSTPEPITGLQLLLDVDLERFALVTNRDAALEATVGPDPDFLGIGFGHYSGLPIIGIVYRLVALREGVVPAGLRQRIVNVVLRPLGDFPGGEVDRVGFAVYSIDERIAEESVFTKLGSESQRPHFTIPGEIRFGTSDPPEPLELHWALEPPAEGGGAQGGGSPRKDVVLRWRNGAAYDAVWIERNGAALAELPGSATEFRDPGVLAGVWTYKVRGVVAGKTTFPARVFLSTISPPGSFLRGDADIDGQITINDPVATLNFLFLGGPALRCDDGADADDDGHLTITDPINTLGYLFLGTSVPRAPGTSFPWFDPTPDSLGCRS